MTSGPPPPSSKPFKKTRPTFLQWLPWEKITIWGLFIALVYALRQFFFVIFMTFILAYSMRGLVSRISRLVSPGKERIWLERVLAVVCFMALLAALTGVGFYFVPKLQKHGQDLANNLLSVRQNPGETIDEVLRDSLGSLLLTQEYLGPGASRYEDLFKEYMAKKLYYKEYEEFGRQAAQIEEEFEEDLAARLKDEPLETPEKQGDLEENKEKGEDTEEKEGEKEKEEKEEKEKEEEKEEKEKEKEKALKKWILENKAEEFYQLSPEQHIKKWRESYKAVQERFELKPLDKLEQEPEYVLKRDRGILNDITKKLYEDSAKRAEYEKEWKESLGREKVRELRSKDPEGYNRHFRDFYMKQREAEPERLVYEYGRYVQLRKAHKEGEVAFSDEFGAHLPPVDPEVRLKNAREGFELRERQKLLDEWKKNEFVQTVSDYVQQQAGIGLTKLAENLRALATKTVDLALYFALSLLLSFFITFDVFKLKKGVKRLEESRLKNFYEEIAPGLISFGRLMGRAFQAQGLIAVCNTLLTFGAIRLLGIENEFFLSAIVFVCSFIPVLGVVLSSIPIALTALIQDTPNSGVELAALAIAAILVVHFIETSILNPKIIGDMMHLHPVLVLAILAIGQHFFGLWGLLLGVPVAVYIIRFVILDEGIPGIIEPVRTGTEAKGQDDAPRAPPPQQDKPAPVVSVGERSGGG